MMSKIKMKNEQKDLVWRLQNLDDCYFELGVMPPLGLLDEAANEIERNRAALAEKDTTIKRLEDQSRCSLHPALPLELVCVECFESERTAAANERADTAEARVKELEETLEEERSTFTALAEHHAVIDVSYASLRVELATSEMYKDAAECAMRMAQAELERVRAALKAAVDPLEIYHAYGWPDRDRVIDKVKAALAGTAPTGEPR